MRRRSGFTLPEVLVAWVLLGVGLTGTVAVVTLAQGDLTAAVRIHVATQAAASVADSILPVGGFGSGSSEEPWGRIEWSAAPTGLRVEAYDRGGRLILDWWIPGAGSGA